MITYNDKATNIEINKHNPINQYRDIANRLAGEGGTSFSARCAGEDADGFPAE